MQTENRINPVASTTCPSFAVYFVPAADSALYRFGTEILGYDCRRGSRQSSKWDGVVGPAHQFGIHLTLCDVLYFANESERKKAVTEVRAIAAEFEPFVIEVSGIKADFPAPRAISVGAQDDSGALEAIHFELVSRVNRRAIASNYSLGLAACDRPFSAARSKLMIGRYHAPYILSAFQPHFTLLASVQPQDMDATYRLLLERFHKAVDEPKLTVRTIAVMDNYMLSDAWMVKEEIGIG